MDSVDTARSLLRTAGEVSALAEAAAAKAEVQADTAAKVHLAAVTAAEACQQEVHAKLAAVVSKALACVFPDDPYAFVLRFERSRGRTVARLAFTRGGEEYDPATASGGGVLDVASFALRVACLCLHRPPRRRFLVLDEPFKHLSRNHTENVAGLLDTLATELGFKFLIITHSDELKVGTVIRVTKAPGEKA